jgi:O-antigen/teichoic acid export membrane protein
VGTACLLIDWSVNEQVYFAEMPEESRSFGRSAATLSAGVGLAGVLTYVFFALASHNLEPVAYGELVVLWSAVFVTISILHRPVEQLISRGVAEHRARGESVGATIRAAALIQGVVALGFALAALALRGQLEDGLLSGDETLYCIYVGSVVAFAASFFARGFLAGEGRFQLLGALLVFESASRMAFSLAVAVGIADGRTAIAVGIAVAPLVSLIVVPLAFARARRHADPLTHSGRPRFSSSSFAAAVFVIMLSEQVLLNGGPLLVNGAEGAAAAGFIFNVLMLARAPLLVFQGIAISLLPHLTRLRSSGSGEADAAFGLSVTVTLRAVAGFTAVVAVTVAAAGPQLMQLAFGDRFDYDRPGLLIVTAAMGLYLAATTLSQAALAQGQARRAASAWGACAVVFLVWSAVPLLEDAARRIEIGLLAAAAVLFALLFSIYRNPRATAEDIPVAGSQAERDARLALADEAS